MSIRRIFLLLVAAVLPVFSARGDESNFWPACVTQADAEGVVSSWTALGPFIFSEPAPAGGRVAGFRPMYVRRTAPSGEVSEVTVFYPIFYYRSYGDMYEWSIFKVINRYTQKEGAEPAAGEEGRTFDLWPFYFSRTSGDPTTTYHALFPIGGTVQGHLGYDQLSWVLFPLYVRSEKHDSVTTSVPWPFIRVTRGAETGFAFWPLFGWKDRPGAFHRAYYLWPFTWNNTIQPAPEAPPGTPATRQIGVLPFYTLERGPGIVNENIFWPFFGYTDRTLPTRYHETRTFWPFLVQGRGDDRYVDRWGPFYTHSIRKGMDKTWAPWPLFRRARWTDGDIAQTRTQVAFFLYWKQEQRSVSNPSAAPAEKVHVWPFVSFWDNGAGRRQFQILSPLEVFFPSNEEVRQSWSPFFALWRTDQRAPGDSRTSLFWNAVTWENHPAQGRSAFHLGPILSVEDGPAGHRIALGSGLAGWKRGPDGRGRLFWLEFRPNSHTTGTEASSQSAK